MRSWEYQAAPNCLFLGPKKEHEKRAAIWILGSSIAGTIVLVGLIAFLLKLFGHGESREYPPMSAAEAECEGPNAVSGQSVEEASQPIPGLPENRKPFQLFFENLLYLADFLLDLPTYFFILAFSF
jgi:hypothetical protein